MNFCVEKSLGKKIGSFCCNPEFFKIFFKTFIGREVYDKESDWNSVLRNLWEGGLDLFVAIWNFSKNFSEHPSGKRSTMKDRISVPRKLCEGGLDFFAMAWNFPGTTRAYRSLPEHAYSYGVLLAIGGGFLSILCCMAYSRGGFLVFV